MCVIALISAQGVIKRRIWPADTLMGSGGRLSPHMKNVLWENPKNDTGRLAFSPMM